VITLLCADPALSTRATNFSEVEWTSFDKLSKSGAGAQGKRLLIRANLPSLGSYLGSVVTNQPVAYAFVFNPVAIYDANIR
jgi:hypothetical protein